MATRGLISIIHNDKPALAVFSSSDSYPNYLGAIILDFAKTKLQTKYGCNKMINQLSKLTKVNEIKRNDPSWYDNNTVLKKVWSGQITKIVDEYAFRKDSLFCKYHYQINLDKKTFTAISQGETLIKCPISDLKKVNIKNNRFIQES